MELGHEFIPRLKDQTISNKRRARKVFMKCRVACINRATILGNVLSKTILHFILGISPAS